MKTYLFTETKSTERGYDVCISLYRIKRGVPVFISESNHHTGSWRGDCGQASQLLHAVHPRTQFDGYTLTSNNIRLFALCSGDYDFVRKEVTA